MVFELETKYNKTNKKSKRTLYYLIPRSASSFQKALNNILVCLTFS